MTSTASNPVSFLTKTKALYHHSGCIRTSFDFSIFIFELSINIYKSTLDGSTDGFGGQFRFFTHWNFCFQTLYFGLCLLTDLLEGEKPPGKERGMLQHWRDVSHSIVFAATLFVVLAFWALHFLNPNFVGFKAPRTIFRQTPPWIRHGITHSAIVVFMMVDKCISFHRYPRRLNGVLATFSVSVIYSIWVAFQSWYANFWVYGILAKVDVAMRILLYIGLNCFMVLLYLVGEVITKLIWRRQISRRTMNLATQQQSDDRPLEEGEEFEWLTEEEATQISVSSNTRTKSYQDPSSSQVEESYVESEHDRKSSKKSW